MDDLELDEIFDDNKLNMAFKKGVKKSTRKTVVVVLIVIFVSNAAITIKLSNEKYDFNKAYIKLHVPNGYISKSSDSIGFLAGRGEFSIARDIAGKPVVLEHRASLFGLIPQVFISRGAGVGGSGGEWTVNYWENGYRKMIFYIPEISYKEYKNDLAKLDRISGDKLIELGLSFDKPYKVADISMILPNVKISWYWVDAFRKDDLARYKKEAIEYDGKATFIREDEVLGVGVKDFNRNYLNLCESLKSSKEVGHNEVYNELVTKGYTDSSNVPILGAIVYGTKDELMSLTGNPHIIASSFGVVVDKY